MNTDSRFRTALLAALVCLLHGSTVLAGSDDAAAQELADEAIFSDYLQLEFPAAEKKLKKAIRVCRRGDCSKTVSAQVHRDLAVVYVTGMKRLKAGKELLVTALELDPEVALDADLTTPELIRVFSDARQEVRSASTKTEKSTETASSEAPPPAEAPVGSMDDTAVDCPPDFPGCESLEERDARLAEEEEARREAGILKNWVSAHLQQDFLMFGGSSGVCTAEGPAQLSCYRAGDNFRNPSELYAGDGGSVGGGFQMATTRLLVGYERRVWPNVHAGVLLGYAIGGGPSEPGGAAFLPIHAEAHGRYTFQMPNLPITPFVMLGGGLAQIDSSVTTEIVDRSAGGDVVVSRVTVWQKTGTSFATLGAGARYAFSERENVSAELKGILLFPSSGMSTALRIGYNYGF